MGRVKTLEERNRKTMIRKAAEKKQKEAAAAMARRNIKQVESKPIVQEPEQK